MALIRGAMPEQRLRCISARAMDVNRLAVRTFESKESATRAYFDLNLRQTVFLLVHFRLGVVIVVRADAVIIPQRRESVIVDTRTAREYHKRLVGNYRPGRP